MCDCDHASVGGIPRTVKARKQHACCECKTTIWPGELYLLCEGKWDDAWETYRVCASCWNKREELQAWLRKQGDNDCVCFGELSTWLEEMKRG